MQTERVPVKVFEDSQQACAVVASRIAELIRTRNRQHRPAVLGLATGHTPIGVYRELIRMHRQEGLDLSDVVTFNLDEYWPMTADVLQSYHRWMHENFFAHVNIPARNIHIPDGSAPREQVEEVCRSYEWAIEQAGLIDLQLLGIGRTGHIGFNEPGSPRDSRTRLVRLDRITRLDAAGDFFGEENVPHHAISMGVGAILQARSICLLAFGEHKAAIVRRAVEEPPHPQVAASFLQEHPDAAVYLDAAAASELTRCATPWLIGSCTWEAPLRRRAVLWLARKLGKAILSLTDEDYNENGLHELLAAGGRAYDLNLEAFRAMMGTITGWPAGKQPGRRVLVFSPHPDDDVISMGATLQRLCQQQHQVHVAYQTSGNIAVWDYTALRFAEFATAFNSIFALAPAESARIEQHVEQFLRAKPPASVDSSEVQAIKTLIRRTEALVAAAFCGVPRDRCHFLDMPFYQTGRVAKLPLGEEDISIVLELLERIRPEVIFAAGDQSDPHGTHRMCLQAVMEALRRYLARGGERPEIWLYRGAWQEWGPHEIDMAVPVSPDEMHHKRHAIFRHESQKDRAMFPGPYDQREFWQRAEDRNRATAKLYDQLGLPQYEAIEAFIRCPPP
jgi:glucosamine-6-phosphate deaminase